MLTLNLTEASKTLKYSSNTHQQYKIKKTAYLKNKYVLKLDIRKDTFEGTNILLFNLNNMHCLGSLVCIFILLLLRCVLIHFVNSFCPK